MSKSIFSLIKWSFVAAFFSASIVNLTVIVFFDAPESLVSFGMLTFIYLIMPLITIPILVTYFKPLYDYVSFSKFKFLVIAFIASLAGIVAFDFICNFFLNTSDVYLSYMANFLDEADKDILKEIEKIPFFLQNYVINIGIVFFSTCLSIVFMQSIFKKPELIL